MVAEHKIDRQKLISGHNPVLTEIATDAPLTVGNGELAFTADITGMQTLYEEYQELPLCTMSQWLSLIHIFLHICCSCGWYVWQWELREFLQSDEQQDALWTVSYTHLSTESARAMREPSM